MIHYSDEEIALDDLASYIEENIIIDPETRELEIISVEYNYTAGGFIEGQIGFRIFNPSEGQAFSDIASPEFYNKLWTSSEKKDSIKKEKEKVTETVPYL